MSERFDTRDADWPLRPWIMATICAVAGLLFDLLTDVVVGQGEIPPLRQAGASFVAIAAISFVLTVEQRRWHWALMFALGWGVVIALVGWFTASYNQQGEIAEFPFLSGLFAVLLAAPLFQTVRDTASTGAAWRFPYPRLHGHAWTDAVIGAASLAFVGVAFLLAWLIGGLFDLIGIDFVKDLLKESWFGWMLAGFAFGASVGLLRERDGLVATLQRLVMVVLGVLAPVLAAALLLFLLSLPFTGLQELWDSSIPATPMMLLAGAGAILLANAVIGNGDDERVVNPILRISAMVLVLTVLPLAIIAALSLGQRIGQYGWTPERIWGVVAVAVAIGYGLAGWWTVAKGRAGFDDLLRPLQTRLALGVCAITLFLALPILDFGAVSASSQMARFTAGKVEAKAFDWQAMAFDFGPAGRDRLREIERRGPPDQRKLASTALASKDRYRIGEEIQARESAVNLDRMMRVLPQGTALPPKLREAIAATRYCRVGRCVVTLIDAERALVAGPLIKDDNLEAATITRQGDGNWSQHEGLDSPRQQAPFRPDLATAPVEIRKVERKQLYIDGIPVGQPFE